MSLGSTQIPVHEVFLGAGISAFFTTRFAGLSKPPWNELNLGANVGDDLVTVLANRALVAERLGSPVQFAEQVHANTVLTLEAPAAGESASCGRGDALVTDRAGLGLGVLVADCVPILLADAGAGVVATSHTGRAGLQCGVLGNTVAAMVAKGARTESIRAVVGPCVCPRCYEVPAALAQDFARDTGVTPSATRWGTTGLDLRAAAHGDLARAGIEYITDVDLCTLEEDQFFSHRRATKNGAPTGRFAGIIALQTTGCG